jgi:hypothetical protein
MSHENSDAYEWYSWFSNLLKTPNLSGEEQQEYIEIIEQSW